MICSRIPSCDAGQGRELQLPGNHTIMKVNNGYTNNSVPMQPFRFSPSVQYSINYVRYSTLHYKVGFVLNDFAQLEANVSVLNMFKVGQAKL